MADGKSQKSILSFRSYLKAKIAPFVADFQPAESASDLLTEFIVVLSMYREEGTDLFPAVFIGEDLKDVLSVTRGLNPVAVGSGTPTRETVRRAFKQCAPLAEGREWAIYVTLKKKALSYGVFRTNPSPIVPTAFENLRQNKDPEKKIIGLIRLGRSFIEFRSGVGLFQFINMMGDHEETLNPKEMIRKFMKATTQDAPANLREELKSFYYRLGVDILHANHGTLLAIIPHYKGIPSLFRDGIILEKKISVLDGISNLLQSNSTESLHQLFAWNQLIRRMTSMDGVTVLDSCGAIVGYNCFVKDPTHSRKQGALATGGARHRAFDVLCSHLGKNLSGVIYKSQDGVVELGMEKSSARNG